MNSPLEKLHTVLLDMLKTVMDFCDDHGIVCFLDSGTLLGAVRHAGFIPWDDDADICMDAENYRKFLECAHELPEKLFVQNYRTDPMMNVIWTKVRRRSTTVLPLHAPMIREDYGACLDVFVMNGYVQNALGRFLQRKADYRLRALMNKDALRMSGEVLPEQIEALQRLPYEQRRASALRAERILLRNLQDSGECYNIFYRPGHEEQILMPSALYDPQKRIRLPFEDTEFWCPQDPEQVLELYYGDWRTPLPEDQRAVHGELFIDTEHGIDYWFRREGMSMAEILQQDSVVE
ncbi:MAG: LicD family protein [Solobacterium sp.]|nr:LicD family protein [Solobacterium sp.]